MIRIISGSAACVTANYGQEAEPPGWHYRAEPGNELENPLSGGAVSRSDDRGGFGVWAIHAFIAWQITAPN